MTDDTCTHIYTYKSYQLYGDIQPKTNPNPNPSPIRPRNSKAHPTNPTRAMK